MGTSGVSNINPMDGVVSVLISSIKESRVKSECRAARTRGVRDQAGDRRAGPARRADARRPAGAGPPAARGRSRRGEDARGGDAREGPRRLLRAHAVHARPGALRHPRNPHLPPGPRGVRHRARPGGRELRARRRDQPRAGQGAVGAARGDGRAARVDRRHTYPMPVPFLVLATQNPIENEGVYPLPEAQRDRFLFKIIVDYPRPEEEREIVYRMGVEPAGRAAGPRARGAAPAAGRRARGLRPPRAGRLRGAARGRHAHARPNTGWTTSPAGWPTAPPRAPRWGIIAAARALALVRGRDYVLPQDVLDVTPDVLRHRLVLSYDALADGGAGRPHDHPGARRRFRCPRSAPGRSAPARRQPRARRARARRARRRPVSVAEPRPVARRPDSGAPGVGATADDEVRAGRTARRGPTRAVRRRPRGRAPTVPPTSRTARHSTRRCGRWS